MSRHSSGPPDKPYQDPPTKPRRKRVVLADSRAPVTVLRTVVELEEQTSYGEELVTQFVRHQLGVVVRLWLFAVGLLIAIPTVFFAVPQLSELDLIGVRLPWLIIGVLPFPLLYGVGYWYNRLVERQEKAFVAMVEK